MSHGNVAAEIQYLKRLSLYRREKPFQLFVPIDETAEDQRSSNLEFESRLQEFVDIRPTLSAFSLDNDGFQVVQHSTQLTPDSFSDRALVEERYLGEAKEILKTIDGGYDKIFIFDWRVRNSATPVDIGELDMNDPTTWLRPSPNVHVDQSPRAVLHRIKLHLPDEANTLLRGRVRIINVWRPIENVVEDYPLAFCAAGSMPDEDLVECDHVRRKFKGANFYAYYNAAHKWYYLGEQRPDEVMLLKMFDSDKDVKAKRCPHASFHHPSSTAESKPRKSIEVRALVFNYLPK